MKLLSISEFTALAMKSPEQGREYILALEDGPVFASTDPNKDDNVMGEPIPRRLYCRGHWTKDGTLVFYFKFRNHLGQFVDTEWSRTIESANEVDERELCDWVRDLVMTQNRFIRWMYGQEPVVNLELETRPNVDQSGSTLYFLRSEDRDQGIIFTPFNEGVTRVNIFNGWTAYVPWSLKFRSAEQFQQYFAQNLTAFIVKMRAIYTKQRRGERLTEEENDFFVRRFTTGEIDAYEMAVWLIKPTELFRDVWWQDLVSKEPAKLVFLASIIPLPLLNGVALSIHTQMGRQYEVLLELENAHDVIQERIHSFTLLSINEAPRLWQAVVRAMQIYPAFRQLPSETFSMTISPRGEVTISDQDVNGEYLVSTNRVALFSSLIKILYERTDLLNASVDMKYLGMGNIEPCKLVGELMEYIRSMPDGVKKTVMQNILDNCSEFDVGGRTILR